MVSRLIVAQNTLGVWGTSASRRKYNIDAGSRTWFACEAVDCRPFKAAFKVLMDAVKVATNPDYPEKKSIRQCLLGAQMILAAMVPCLPQCPKWHEVKKYLRHPRHPKCQTKTRY